MANYSWDKLQKYMEGKKDSMEKVVYQSMVSVSTDIILNTPVDEGFARNSWTMGINTTSVNYSTVRGPVGTAAINRVKGEMKKFKLGDEIYLLSNLVYMPVLEFGQYGTGAGATYRSTRDGFSVQAPNGMVRVAINRFQAGLDEAIKNEQ